MPTRTVRLSPPPSRYLTFTVLDNPPDSNSPRSIPVVHAQPAKFPVSPRGSYCATRFPVGWLLALRLDLTLAGSSKNRTRSPPAGKTVRAVCLEAARQLVTAEDRLLHHSRIEIWCPYFTLSTGHCHGDNKKCHWRE